ncbi:MAG: hypothetical protein PHP92_03740 [Candidatus Nanoarchaeia archaeon]|nr:hypothetical protein [Candidatus Nanoarchaeia archaeon]
MIKEALLKSVAIKISVEQVKNKINELSLSKMVCALKKEGIENIMCDEKYLYVSDEQHLAKVSDKLNNRIWLEKIARHRIMDDCAKCKHLDEDGHLGKLWCKKWDTDIWNVSTPFKKPVVNRGCVPFRYFGFAPDDPERQSQFNLKYASAEKADLIKQFVEEHDLKDVGDFNTDENIFAGQFDPEDRFAFRYEPETDTIQMLIEVADKDKRFVTEYPAERESLNKMFEDWREGWGFNYTQAENFRGNAPRQDTSFDYTTSDEYKKKNNLQKTKQYDISPTNTGDKYPPLVNSFSDGDKDVSVS